MIIDAHLHIWDPTRADYPWFGPWMGDLERPIGFPEIAPQLAARGIGGAVLVQAADDARDTRNMLEAADAEACVLGVVAYSPLDDAVRLAADLESYAADPRVVGIRNLIHEHDRAWLDRPEIETGLALLARAQMPLDFPVNDPAALRQLAGIARRHPELPLVLDHLGHPPIGLPPAAHEEWRELVAACAAAPNVTAKLSGLYSATGDLAAWTTDGIRPFVDDALDLFGPDRLIYGGDWPISELAGGYPRTWAAVGELLEPLSPAEREAILGGTATRVYALPTPTTGAS